MTTTKRKPTLLVVDDEYITHRIVNVILSGKDYTILSAYNGVEAIEQLERHQVDMVLTDVNMPLMDGLELISRLRSDERFQDLPVVIISASPLPQVPKEAVNKGATAFISQPFSSWELTKVVGDCLELDYAPE
jgi:CheY-like chemotaxis protein